MSHRRLPAVLAAAGLALGATAWIGGAASAAPAQLPVLQPSISWDGVSPSGPNRYGAPTDLKAKTGGGLNPAVTKATWTAKPAGNLPQTCGGPRAGDAKVSGGSVTFQTGAPCNGAYTVSLVGKGALGTSSNTLTAPIQLAVPAAKPAAPNGVDGGNKVAHLGWAQEGYPDLVGYRIERQGASARDVPAGTGTVDDVVPQAGTYRYRIAVLRWGADGPGSAPVASEYSDYRSVTVTDGGIPQGQPQLPGSGGGSGGSGGGSGSGGSGSGGGPRPAGGTELPSAPGAKASVPKGSASSSAKPRYRSGGVIAPRVPGAPPTTVDTGYSDKLPYDDREPGDEQAVKKTLTGPGREQVSTKLVDHATKSKPGIVLPIAVALVLIAAALHLRWLVSRSQDLAAAGDGGEPGGDGSPPYAA